MHCGCMAVIMYFCDSSPIWAISRGAFKLRSRRWGWCREYICWAESLPDVLQKALFPSRAVALPLNLSCGEMKETHRYQRVSFLLHIHQRAAVCRPPVSALRECPPLVRGSTSICLWLFPPCCLGSELGCRLWAVIGVGAEAGGGGGGWHL